MDFKMARTPASYSRYLLFKSMFSEAFLSPSTPTFFHVLSISVHTNDCAFNYFTDDRPTWIRILLDTVKELLG